MPYLALPVVNSGTHINAVGSFAITLTRAGLIFPSTFQTLNLKCHESITGKDLFSAVPQLFPGPGSSRGNAAALGFLNFLRQVLNRARVLFYGELVKFLRGQPVGVARALQPGADFSRRRHRDDDEASLTTLVPAGSRNPVQAFVKVGHTVSPSCSVDWATSQAA